MGLGRFLKCLVNSEEYGKVIIELQENAYREALKMYPDADPHILLAHIWLSRMAEQGSVPGDQRSLTIALSETMQFACVPPPNNARALGLYFIYKERPDIIEHNPKFNTEFHQLMAPVFAAIEKGQIDSLYSRLNPQMAKEVPKNSDDRISSDNGGLVVVLGKIASALYDYISQSGISSLFKDSTVLGLTKDKRIFISQRSPDNILKRIDIIHYVSINDLPGLNECRDFIGDGSSADGVHIGVDLLARAILTKLMPYV